MKSKSGFVLLWTLVIFAAFLSWLSLTLSEINETIHSKRRLLVIEERMRAESMMISHYETETSNYQYIGKYIKYYAVKEDKKISVNVVGTTNLNYVYVIIEDGSLVLETMEE